MIVALFPKIYFVENLKNWHFWNLKVSKFRFRFWVTASHSYLVTINILWYSDLSKLDLIWTFLVKIFQMTWKKRNTLSHSLFELNCTAYTGRYIFLKSIFELRQSENLTYFVTECIITNNSDENTCYIIYLFWM